MQYPRAGSHELPLSVEVKFDPATSTLLDQQGNYSVQPQSFRFPGRRGKNKNRLQLPLAEAFAVNVRKVQSLSLERAAVYMGKQRFSKGNLTTTVLWSSVS